MKTITIRLADVETAVLVEVQKVNRLYKDLRKHSGVGTRRLANARLIAHP